MTLFNQINSLLFGLFLLVMSSLVYFQFTQTKTFMDNQIESDLNNTTHALTLMLQPHLETGDTVAVETVINVIFEGGFYKTVSLTWLSDQHTQTWENPIKVRGVPQWFLDLGLFEQQSTQNTITNGWMQLATLKIEANPAIGYAQLWRVMNDTLMILAALFILSLMALRFRLKRILAPLHLMADQAKLIAKREFHEDLVIPQTIELKEVVLAMNSMSGQLQDVFSQLDKEVVALKHEKLTDRVSQLPNRLFFNTQLASWISEPGYGGLMIARLDWLDTIYEQFGYQVRDNTIKILAKEMQATLPNVAPCVISRISKKEFAFLVTKASSEKLSLFLQSTIRLINQAIQSTNNTGDSHFTIGAADRSTDMTGSELLANADKALQFALKANLVSHHFESELEEDMTLPTWEGHLLEAINNQQFLLQWHPVIAFKNNKVIHHELYCRIKIENEVVRAAQFMPNIELLVLGSEFDRSLLQAIVGHPMIEGNTKPIAINITQDSVVDEIFQQWLSQFLKKQKDCNRLHFELRESTIVAYPKQSLAFAHIVKERGAHIGIDNCGREMGSLSYLQSIKPDYVKLDQSLSCKINNEMDMGELQERLDLTQAVINTARGLGIEVILTAIENNEELVIVQALEASGYQGFITPPSDLYVK